MIEIIRDTYSNMLLHSAVDSTCTIQWVRAKARYTVDTEQKLVNKT